MDPSNKTSAKNQNTNQVANYSPWNLLFSTRPRTESETSSSSTSSGYQAGKKFTSIFKKFCIFKI